MRPLQCDQQRHACGPKQRRGNRRSGQPVGAPIIILAALWAAHPAHAGDDAGSRAAATAPAHDFIAEARLIYRAVACGDASAPAGADAPASAQGSGAPTAPNAWDAWDARHRTVVAAHCRVQRPRVARFRSKYLDRARPFIAAQRPQGLPTRVVYPFGGGDLASALVTYPEATEITTISLEHAGDPRRIADLGQRVLRDSLAVYRDSVAGLLRNHDSASVNMRKLEQGPIPGQLSFFLQALVALDYEPVSLRFFRLEDDGGIHYLSTADIEQLEPRLARKKAKSWGDTDHSVAFSNAELRFRPRGGGPVVVHRHISANLNDGSFPGSPVHQHLLAKGKVAAMTKAASYLLWNNYFSGIRDYLLQNMVFMISDSTGIPPGRAARAGFEQITFGRFTRSFLEASQWINDAFMALWKGQSYRALPFRYGYPDAAGNFHMLITRPRAPAPRPESK